MNRAASIAPLFDAAQCAEIIAMCHRFQPETGLVRGTEMDPETRISKIRWVPRAEATASIFKAVDAQVAAMNAYWHKVDYRVDGCADFQFSEYRGPDGFYRPHQDNDLSNDRKLSFTILLNNAFDGGRLVVRGAEMDIRLGEICVFPAILMHSVQPVTMGTRYSLVGWYEGPPWR
ncbi:MAG: 2OG-Fe(II) oxygenase [Gammaproteobacteria bacterium]|nr:2OG-Fe(II) oxygenase [Gammaproteobacteria bacterium]MYG67111.1 2OG-Fe(II) oxygenase [Gammaproteobacteria bacterium]